MAALKDPEKMPFVEQAACVALATLGDVVAVPHPAPSTPDPAPSNPDPAPCIFLCVVGSGFEGVVPPCVALAAPGVVVAVQIHLARENISLGLICAGLVCAGLICSGLE